jgi:hypothetical protein
MIDKKWVLKTVDGELPNDEEIEQLQRWLTHDDSRPVVHTMVQRDPETRQVTRCEFAFERTSGRVTCAMATTELERLRRFADKQRQFIEVVKLSVEAGDIEAIKKLYGVE